MNLRRAIACILPSFRREVTCGRCGQRFVCGASGEGCWCAEIKLSEAARTQMRRNCPDCLCRACLEQVAAGASAGESEGV